MTAKEAEWSQIIEVIRQAGVPECLVAQYKVPCMEIRGRLSFYFCLGNHFLYCEVEADNAGARLIPDAFGEGYPFAIFRVGSAGADPVQIARSPNPTMLCAMIVELETRERSKPAPCDTRMEAQMQLAQVLVAWKEGSAATGDVVNAIEDWFEAMMGSK